MEIHIARIWKFVSGDQPRTKHCVGIDRFAKTLELGAADRHVESDSIACHVVIRLIPSDIGPALADNDRQFRLMIIATIREALKNPFPRTDQGARRLQEQTPLT